MLLLHTAISVGIVVGLLFLFYKLLFRPKANANALQEICKTRNLRVLVTGGSKGIGYALAKKFAQLGDSVTICSRKNVEQAVQQLKSECKTEKIFGTACDVANYDQVQNLIEYAANQMGGIDLVINNAGTDGQRANLDQLTAAEIKTCIDTNLLGTIYVCKAAIAYMKQKQQSYGHIFTMEGKGSRGDASPTLATYAATKYAIVNLTASLSQEVAGTNIGVHRTQPGMVMTELLVHGDLTLGTKKIFNILAEEAHVVADNLVPRLRQVKGTNAYIPFLTMGGVLYRFATFFLRSERFFDAQGKLKVKLQ